MTPRIPLSWIVGAVLLALLLVQTVRIEGLKIWPLSIKGLSTELSECKTGRKADRTAYEAAQAQAKADNLSHVRKVESEQRAKTDAIQSRWDADRARLAELLRKGNAAAQGNAGPARPPEVPGTAEGSDGAGEVCIPEGDALSAAENELKLFYLQEWIRGQLRVSR